MENRLFIGRTSSPGLVFDGKPYEPGATYRWEDLPSLTRREARAQTDDIEVHYGRDYKDALYRLMLIPSRDAEDMLRRRLGRDFETALRDPSVKRMAQDIRRDGLKYPPILEEGYRRALALVLMGRDVPYFSVAETVEEPTHIPTLDGHPKR